MNTFSRTKFQQLLSQDGVELATTMEKDDFKENEKI